MDFRINPHHRKREQQSMKVAAFKKLNQYGLSDKTHESSLAW
jgi:hypothetical protein